MPKIQPIAPVYRYFTADLLTNEILTEIPLRGVSYSCALKAGGKFSGKIPVTAETDSMNLYDSTMPGNTALYVVRNGKCVWGGIIWSRGYELGSGSNDLSISASEFTSYFYHRRIWKTWNHQAGATLIPGALSLGVFPATMKVQLDPGSSIVPKPGSTIHIEFYEPESFQYNGLYRVLAGGTISKSSFEVTAGPDVSDIVSYETFDSGNRIRFYTKEAHNYSVGDGVSIQVSHDPAVPNVIPSSLYLPFARTVTATGGASSNYFEISFSIQWGGGNLSRRPVQGIVFRTVPARTYESVTITARQDSFDYIRTLIDSMFDDFVGSEFPNVYIEPGVSFGLPVTSKRISNGRATLEMTKPHGVAPGQAIQVKNLGKNFDGEFMVTDTPTPTSIMYAKGGAVPLTNVSTTGARISNVTMTKGVVTATTVAPHGLEARQSVVVGLAAPYDDFAGTFTIRNVLSDTKFTYDTGTGKNYSSTNLTQSLAQVAGKPSVEIKSVWVPYSSAINIITSTPSTFVEGDSVTISNTDRDLLITEKTFDAPNSRATIKTKDDHGLTVGDTVVISGLYDGMNSASTQVSGSSVTMTTERPHNVKKGDAVVLQGIDTYEASSYSITNNKVTLNVRGTSQISAGSRITISDAISSYRVTTWGLTNNVARLVTDRNHNLKVNDEIVVSYHRDYNAIVSKEALDGIATVRLSTPHNILEGNKVEVTGLGVPFDGKEIIVDSITDTTISYQIDESYYDQAPGTPRKGQKFKVPVTIPASKGTGQVWNSTSIYNGEHVITEVTANTLKFQLSGNDQGSLVATGGAGVNGDVSGYSVVNGTHIVESVQTSGRSIIFPFVANDETVLFNPPGNAEEARATVVQESVYSGTRTVTSVSSRSITFTQGGLVAGIYSGGAEIRKGSIFNGTRTVTSVPSSNRVSFTLTGYSGNVYEQAPDRPAFLRATNLYNGTWIVGAPTGVPNTLSLTREGYSIGSYKKKDVVTRGTTTLSPEVIVSTFGPFPGNSDIGMSFESRGFTGVTVAPTAYRGFELKSVGEVLDSYSDNLNGFEYRIDCFFDEARNKFTKKFVIVPIDFPDPPATGTVAPLSRYNADKLIFEYPGGNITAVSINESAEESATRFFAVGETDLGPDAGPNIGVASSSDLLTGKRGRRWPLLDDVESVKGTDDKKELYGHAKRYLSESAPPYATMNVSLNGSIAPFVGTYRPGDWCALILNDPFMQMRLKSTMEPRKDVFVRKISSYSVTVPDGVTFPERVSLNVVAEWEVDKVGQ